MRRFNTILTNPAGASFSPSDVSGLKLWLKDTIVGADGDAVGTWADSSGNGYDATQATAGNKPTLKTGIKNGRQVVRFDGTDDALDSTALLNIITNTAFSAFIVVNAKAMNSTSTGNLYPNEAIWTEKNSGNTGLYIYKTAGVPTIGWEHYGGGEKVVKTSLAVDTWYIVHMRHEAGVIYISINNGTETSISSGNTSVSNPIRFGCGYDTPSSSNAAQIDLAEVIFYNTAVGSTDRTSIQTYLNSRWAVY